MSAETEQAIYEMLTENTGRSLCDSGGVFGRHHERNARRTLADFRAEPEATYEVYLDQLRRVAYSCTLSLFHWLAGKMEYDPALTGELTAHAATSDGSWFSAAADWLDERRAQGPDGWAGFPVKINTANNGGSCLSQVVQYTGFSWGGHSPDYVVLFVHGGCDVRSGYTAPRVFKLRQGFSSILNDSTVALCGESADAVTRWDKYAGNSHAPRTERGERLIATCGHMALADFPYEVDTGQPRKPGVIYVTACRSRMTCPITCEYLTACGADE